MASRRFSVHPDARTRRRLRGTIRIRALSGRRRTRLPSSPAQSPAGCLASPGISACALPPDQRHLRMEEQDMEPDRLGPGRTARARSGRCRVGRSHEWRAGLADRTHQSSSGKSRTRSPVTRRTDDAGAIPLAHRACSRRRGSGWSGLAYRRRARSAEYHRLHHDIRAQLVFPGGAQSRCSCRGETGHANPRSPRDRLRRDTTRVAGRLLTRSRGLPRDQLPAPVDPLIHSREK